MLICFIREVIRPIVFVPVIAMGVIILWALLQSMVRWMVAADVALPTWTPFSKVPDSKTVKTLRHSHVGGVDDDF
jgi:hypothetical protein